MSEKYRTIGLVFGREDRLEADKLFNVYTEDFGRIELYGKAIRKINSKLKAGLDLFYLSEIEFIQGKNHKTLTDTYLINKFENIPTDAKKTEIAFRISNVIKNFIKGHGKDNNLFSLLQESFTFINGETKNCELIFYYFVWNFLANQGYKPEVNKCVICQCKLEPQNLFFSIKEGGVICKNCFSLNKKVNKINSDIVKLLRIILNKDWQILSKLKVQAQSLEVFKDISEKAILEFEPANV